MQPGMAMHGVRPLQTAAEYAIMAACAWIAWCGAAEVWGQISSQYGAMLAQLESLAR